MAAMLTAEIYVADLAIVVAALRPGVRAKRKSSEHTKKGFRLLVGVEGNATFTGLQRTENYGYYLDLGFPLRQACHLVPTNG